MNIDGLFTEINLKNDIARPTIRGRLSDMIKDGEVKRIGGDQRNTYSEAEFEAITVTIQKQNIRQMVEIKTQQNQKTQESRGKINDFESEQREKIKRDFVKSEQIPEITH